MNYRLSDFTLAGWILNLTFPVVAIVAAIYWGQFMLWVFGRPQMDIPNGVLALPGLVYLGLYWATCQLCGIRLLRRNRGYDDAKIPWRTLSIIVVGIFGPVVLVFGILVINRLLNPV